MKVTKSVIDDLIPLYAANECSADTRVLVEEYLQSNPEEAAALKRALEIEARLSHSRGVLPSAAEVEALGEAKRRLRARSWFMAFGIFFSLVPFSFLSTEGRTYWLLLEAPRASLAYFVIGAGFWIAYLVSRSRANVL